MHCLSSPACFCSDTCQQFEELPFIASALLHWLGQSETRESKLLDLGRQGDMLRELERVEPHCRPVHMTSQPCPLKTLWAQAQGPYGSWGGRMRCIRMKAPQALGIPQTLPQLLPVEVVAPALALRLEHEVVRAAAGLGYDGLSLSILQIIQAPKPCNDSRSRPACVAR